MRIFLTLLLAGLSLTALGQQNFTNKLDEKGEGDRKIPLFKRLKQFRLDYYEASSEPHFSRYESRLYLRFIPNHDKDWPFFPMTRGGKVANFLYGIHLHDRASGKDYYLKDGSAMPMDGGQLLFDNFGGEIRFWLGFEQLPESVTSFDVYFNNTLWFSKVKIDPKADVPNSGLKDDYYFGRIAVYSSTATPIRVFANGRLAGTLAYYFPSGQSPNNCGANGTMTIAFSKDRIDTPVDIYGESSQEVNGYIATWTKTIAPKQSFFNIVCNWVKF